MLLELDLDDAGRVGAARVLASGGRDFDEAALAAARDFVFDPARVEGRPVPSRLRYRYVFRPPAERPVDEDAPRPSVSASVPFDPPRAVLRTRRPAAVAVPVESVEPESVAVVRGRSTSREPWRRELVAEDLRRMPGTRGDALLAVQNLPGVGRPPFGLGAFVLRGSDPEDSLVTLEGQPLGLAFHLYGLATTLATELIERVEVLPGNFSARWGRAGGGVVNVVLRAPARDRVHASVDVDLIDAGVFASAPLGRNASVALGARRSYVDLTLAPFAPSDGARSFTRLPRYWDWQVALDADLSARDSVRVIGSGSDDSVVLNFGEPDPNDPNLRGAAGSSVVFHGAQSRWRHRFGSSAQHTLAPAVSWSHQRVNLGPEVLFDIRTTTVSLRDELELRLGRRGRLFVGLDLQAGRSSAVLVAPPLSPDGITDPTGATGLVAYNSEYGFVNPGAYVEAELEPTSALRFLTGVRVDHYSRFDSTTVDPRFTVQLRPAPRWVLRTGLGTYSSPPRGYVVLPGFGNPGLRPERWTHSALGALWEAIPGALELSADGFVKTGDGTAAPSDRMVVRDGQNTSERFANTGDARVMGVELLARLRPGRWPWFAWVAYTFQRALRRDAEGRPWYPSTWDQPHLLTLMVGALLPRGWEVGARFRWTSGLTEPRVTGALYDADHDVALTRVERWDPGRLPDFLSLDLRVAKSFRWGPLRMQAVLDVLNATNNANAESRIYAYDRRRSVVVTGLPILPSLGLRAEY